VRWTTEEVSTLEWLFTRTAMSCGQIALVLRRSRGSVARKAQTLGLDESERPTGYVRWRGGRPRLSAEEKARRRKARAAVYRSMEHW
jgi:hypothetical protein